MAEQSKNGKSEFLAAFKKSPNLAKGLKQLANAKDPNAVPDIPDGVYVARINGIKFGAYNSVPNARIGFKIDKGPQKDVVVTKRYDFGKTRPDSTLSEEEIFNQIGIDLQRMGINKVKPEPESLAAAFEDLASNSPLIQINVSSKKSGNGKTYLNVYPNKVVEAATAEKTEEAESEDAEEEVDTEEVPVEKGDCVLYQPPGGSKESYQVVLSNPQKRVCSIRLASDPKAGTIANVSWDEVEIEMEEE